MKFRTIKRKKRRGFFGTRPQDAAVADLGTVDGAADLVDEPRPGPSNQAEVDETLNKSFEKLGNSSFSEIEESHGTITRYKSLELALRTEEMHQAKGFKLFDAELLEHSMATAFLCRNCENKETKIKIVVDETKREGLAESLTIFCKHCGFQTAIPTSKHVSTKGRGTLEVNIRSVISSYQWGRAGLEKFCGGMGLPPPLSSRSYNQQIKKLACKSVTIAEKVMSEAAEQLFKIVEEEEPTKIEMMQDGKKVAKVAVTVDGTWQKRGHSSRVGVVFVISVRTGQVLDYVIKSLFCHECKSHEKDDKDTAKYKNWHQKHVGHCHINHEGASGNMEVDGAVEIFTRSIEKRFLKYTEFIGDGDSSTFGKVKEALQVKYGDDYSVLKEECVGHVQKRIGTSLREYKRRMKKEMLPDGKPVGGKGRLTKAAIDSIQNYYGLAIRRNAGNKDGMKNSIMAIQHHMVKSEKLSLEQQHQYCPQEEATWCKYWREKIFGDGKYNQENRLPAVFHKELKPIFDRLSQDELLNRCLRGLTQNQNESLNGQLWTNRCPKTKYCGVKRVTIAVCEAVSVFNTGTACKAMLMQSLGVTDLGSQTLNFFRKENKRRIENMKRKSSVEFKARRKELRMKKKRIQGKPSETFYKPGAFGLEVEPEVEKCAKKKQSRKRPYSVTKKTEVPNITFCDEKDIFVTVERKKKR